MTLKVVIPKTTCLILLLNIIFKKNQAIGAPSLVFKNGYFSIIHRNPDHISLKYIIRKWQVHLYKILKKSELFTKRLQIHDIFQRISWRGSLK